MPTYLTNTAIVFNDGTAQYTATPNGFGALNTYAILMNVANFNYAGVGHIVFGSNLRYDFLSSHGGFTEASRGTDFNSLWIQYNNSTFGGGGNALSGTWRKMSSGPTYRTTNTCCGVAYIWASALYIRIS